LAVGCVLQEERVLVAGGYLVQLLPEVDQEAIGQMVDRLTAMASIDELLIETKADPLVLMNTILQDRPYTETGKCPLCFNCNCSTERVLGSLATIARSDIEALVKDNRVIEIECDFCGKKYRLSPNQLRGLLVNA
jgi:molecular chaperone Hsp33